MPDYMFLLESRLSPEQRAALERVQELGRLLEMNLYLTGGAVRDLISGQSIRDLDFTVEGNPTRMVRELEKGGARIVWESEKLRHHELLFAGGAEGSISAARDDVYERPGAKPDYRFSGISEDLRRRDFSINAIAISLNVQSRGLLLDPTNGLADLERQEVRALSIHAFTNQPVRLMRALRYCARMGFQMEARTQEWFDLAMERSLNETIAGPDVGHEVRAVAREENPGAALKLWESKSLLEAIHPQLQRRKPAYDDLAKVARIRANYVGMGLRPRLETVNLYYIFGKLNSRDASSAMKSAELRQAEIHAVHELVPEAQKIVKVLKGRKTNAPRDAYAFIGSVPVEMLIFIEVEMPSPPVMSKIRNYMQKWRPLWLSMPRGELDALGVPRGPKFEKILEQLFDMQLRGKGKTPEDRTKLLRDLAGIREEPAKKLPKKRKGKGEGETSATPEAGAKPAAQAAASPKPASSQAAKSEKKSAGAAVKHASHAKSSSHAGKGRRRA
jgi:tRNA nucleotidyltransferase (CCA-adding enzyme)